MSANGIIPACLIIDDFPANASYWAREQRKAFGYAVPVQSSVDYGWNWPEQAAAPFMPLSLLHQFADFVEECDVRGKFTVLPCPAGMGRIDRRTRAYADADLQELLAVVRERLVPRFDITPEVLTHTMAFDLDTEALLPHSERAWIAHLSATGRVDALQAYFHQAYTILHNVGIQAHGLTIGGLPDPSGIAQGQVIDDHRENIAKALLAVEKEFSDDVADSFLYTGAPSVIPRNATRMAPEVIYASPRGERVYELIAGIDEQLLPCYRGTGDVAAETDKLVSPDLASGVYIDCINARGSLVIVAHAQTMMSLNTGQGFQVLRNAVRRLRERYGAQLVWQTPLELSRAVGVAPDK